MFRQVKQSFVMKLQMKTDLQSVFTRQDWSLLLISGVSRSVADVNKDDAPHLLR